MVAFKINLPTPLSASLQWIRFPSGQRQQGSKFFMGERLAFCRTLHLNDATVFGHHHVHVGFCGGIFNVFQIAKRFTVNDTRQKPRQPCLSLGWFSACRPQPVCSGIGQRHAGTGNRRGTRTAVSLNHVAVQRNGEFAEDFQINGRRAAHARSDVEFPWYAPCFTFSPLHGRYGYGSHAAACRIQR